MAALSPVPYKDTITFRSARSACTFAELRSLERPVDICSKDFSKAASVGEPVLSAEVIAIGFPASSTSIDSNSFEVRAAITESTSSPLSSKASNI